MADKGARRGVRSERSREARSGYLVPDAYRNGGTAEKLVGMGQLRQLGALLERLGNVLTEDASAVDRDTAGNERVAGAAGGEGGECDGCHQVGGVR